MPVSSLGPLFHRLNAPSARKASRQHLSRGLWAASRLHHRSSARGWSSARAEPEGLTVSPLVEMEVTRHNFKESLPLVEQALADCQYYAFDCEFTGLFLDDRQGSYLDDMEDRYLEMTNSASRFVITQFGLSCFVWEGGQYRARTFNFYTFPRPFDGWDRRFVCQASSLDFLAGCGFDFNKFIHDGISFLPVAVRDAKLGALERRREREDILLTKKEDIEFVDRLKASVTEWLQGEEEVLLLEAGNSYQRAIQYQQLRRAQFGAAQPPGFIVTKDDSTGRTVLRLSRATPEEAAAWEEEQLRLKVESIRDAAGFSAVFELMRDSGKPAVGHNPSFDLAYSLHSFADALPPSWEGYKGMVAHWFPGGVWDTKHLAASLPGGFIMDTALGSVHDGLLKGGLAERVAEFFAATAEQQPEEQRALRSAAGTAGTAAEERSEGELELDMEGGWALPVVRHAPGFGRYEGADTPAYAHEAGYDAYMTGAAFACLLRLYEAAAAAGAAAGAGAGASLAGQPISNGGLPSGEGAEEGEEEQDREETGMGSDMEEEEEEGDEEEAGSGGGEREGRPSLAAVAGLKWRINLSRSDYPYAALQGPDPQPDRSHVFLITGWPPGAVRYGGEISRRLAYLGLGQLRATMVMGGTGVLLEVADREAVPRALGALEKAVADDGWTVQPYSAYAALKAQQAQQPRDMRPAFGSRAPKRPRPEVPAAQQAEQAQQGQQPEGQGIPAPEEGVEPQQKKARHGGGYCNIM